MTYDLSILVHVLFGSSHISGELGWVQINLVKFLWP